jgi:hypothetical protein
MHAVFFASHQRDLYRHGTWFAAGFWSVTQRSPSPIAQNPQRNKLAVLLHREPAA